MAVKKSKYKSPKLEVICAHCGKKFEQGSLEQWSDIIQNHKPACSYECNKELGQTK